jgi:hypothetical protein
MSKTCTWLLEHKQNIYSQTGEDGIIEKILELIPQNDNWCVEFGAWDGLYLTNTRYLIESKNSSAVLIEADEVRFKELEKNYSQRTNVTTINRCVGFSDNDSLDHILSETLIPIDFDLLSIDIDGNDFHVWKAIKQYEPKIIVIEFNPTIPTEIRFIQPADPAINQGASLLSFVDLAKEKGYELVSVLSFNAFFVKKEYYHLFEIEFNSPSVLRTDLSNITYLFSGYDGHIFLHGSCRMPWHTIELDESRFQILPRYLQRFSGNYTTLDKIIFGLYLLFTHPMQGIKLFQKRN